MVLGVCGFAMGIRVLASKETNTSEGWHCDPLRTKDGWRDTVWTSVYGTVCYVGLNGLVSIDGVQSINTGTHRTVKL